MTPITCLKLCLKHLDLSQEMFERTWKSHCREYVYNRFLVAAALRYYTKASFPQIAKLIGKDDHTSVMHAINAVKEKEVLVKRFEALQEFIDARAVQVAA